MKRILLYFLILFFVAGISLCFAQDKKNDGTLKAIEADILSFRNGIALQKIDSLLKKPLNSQQIQNLKTLKVETLVQTELYEEALSLSEEVLNDKNLISKNRVNILLERALLYEILEDFEKSEKELEKVSTIYSKGVIKKEKRYGKYLYRKSSLYRIKDQDSLAKKYAVLAKDFGDTHNYKYVSAVSTMLLGFLTDSTGISKRLFYFNEALSTWKSIEDWHGIGGMYYSISKTFKNANNPEMAMKYCDSVIWIGSPNNDISLVADAFKLKSEIFESTQKYDSALVYFKRYQKMSDKYNLIQKNIKVSQLDFQFQIEKENLQKNLLVKDLKKVRAYNINLIILIVILVFVLCMVGLLIRKLFKRNKSIIKQKEKIKASNAELEISVSEKEILLKELHHRVKNNLSLILSLVNFQMNDAENVELKKHFSNLENRIKAIAVAHEQFIYDLDQRTDGAYNLKEYLLTIANSLKNLCAKKIILNANIQVIEVTLDTALPIGIMINELVSNTIKHAIVKSEQIIINLNVKDDTAHMIVEYADNGEFFSNESAHNSLGIFIIESMVAQLNGSYTRDGCKYTFNLEKK